MTFLPRLWGRRGDGTEWFPSFLGHLAYILVPNSQQNSARELILSHTRANGDSEVRCNMFLIIRKVTAKI